MNHSLRPMHLGAILDRTVHIYRRRFLVFAGLAAICAVPMILIAGLKQVWPKAWAVAPLHGVAAIYLWTFASGWASYEAVRILGIVVQPAFVTLASGSLLGRSDSFRESVRIAAAHWRSSLWIGILKVTADILLPLSLIAGVDLLLIAPPHRAIAPKTDLLGPLLHLLASGVGYALLLWLGACFSFAIPALVVEGKTGWSALRRSITLTKGSRIRIASPVVIASLSVWLLSWSFQFVLAHLMPLIGSAFHMQNIMRGLYAPAAFVVSISSYIVVGPFALVAITLFYYDQRIRLEGYDVERMMDAAGLNADPGSLSVEA